MAEAKVMPFTSVFAEREILAVKEWQKVAVSADPLGTVAGDQSFGSFQLLVGGEESQVALPAKTLLGPKLISRTAAVMLRSWNRFALPPVRAYRGINFVWVILRWASLGCGSEFISNLSQVYCTKSGASLRGKFEKPRITQRGSAATEFLTADDADSAD